MVDESGEVVEQSRVRTRRKEMYAHFATRLRTRVVLEVGTHSPWVSRQLAGYGHEVYVADPSAMYGARRRRRNDRMDAAYLARLGRVDVQLLHAIQHRSEATQAHLAQLRALLGVRFDRIRDTLPHLLERFGGLTDANEVKRQIGEWRVTRARSATPVTKTKPVEAE